MRFIKKYIERMVDARIETKLGNIDRTANDNIRAWRRLEDEKMDQWRARADRHADQLESYLKGFNQLLRERNENSN